MEQANEVQEALGRTYGMPDIDDADLDAGKFRNALYPHHLLAIRFFILYMFFL